MPNKVGTYTIIASFSIEDNHQIHYDSKGQILYSEFLPVEKTFIVTKSAPGEHKYTITSYWGGQKFTADIKLSDSQYQSLKTAKKNKKTKGITEIHTNKYLSVKKTITKKLVICKIKNNKKIWTKNWKSKNNKFIKQGYKAKRYTQISKKNGKIWITYKKTSVKKYEIRGGAVSTLAKDGLYKKGDYISLYGPEPLIDIKITI